MDIENAVKDIRYGNFAIYLDGMPVAYGVKHDNRISLDIPYTDSKLFQSTDAAKQHIIKTIDDALRLSEGSITFTVNYGKGMVKQVATNGYRRLKVGEKPKETTL